MAGSIALVDPSGRAISAADYGPAQTTGAYRQREPRIFNPRSGLGTNLDRNLGSSFIAQRIERQAAETIYQMSWAAAKMINIPVDDMFRRGRRFTDEDKGKIEAVEEAEDALQMMHWLPEAMKAGRIWGTALMIICTEDGDFERPIAPEEIKPGSITNLWVVDRWACSVQTWHVDPTKPHYGQPYHYRVSGRIFGSPSGIVDPYGIQPTTSQNVVVHASRVIRFDGQRSPLTEGWISGPWEREWGVSILTRAVEEILRDATTRAGIGHLMTEASVWVNKIHDYKEALKGRPDPSAPTAAEIAEETSMLRSLYRTHFVDSEDEVERINVVFSGIADLFDRQTQILAAIADIPHTRFMSQSPAGMNATGKSDADNYAMMVKSNQQRTLKPAITTLDRMMAANLGMAEPLEYEWLPLFDTSEKDQAEIAKLKAEAVQLAVSAFAIDEVDARRILDGDLVFGALPGDPPEPPDPVPPAPPAGARPGGAPRPAGAART